ncbi:MULTISPECIES: GcrA family cell cycle regulator [unclassified Pseudovibrio]|uniref:GcrA family cell cycle regulator n=1 Tax=unclassified Pseudovibrio TaxID=2627060 RepID=UPI0007AE67A5|nr:MULTISPECIES: GcrA family cell cycle regulator [unclassified Pseudovibrio]KZL14182.1 GcrA cell cycle regulator [Pseudovibrio sp. Ad26]KZL27049.1 GcrA cell cycle regulator [Pseudovibrio sp. Ad37]
MSWTAERVELLTKLWADGLSASQIAGELGNVTRNAVIGKVHRLGLSGRAKSGGGATKTRKVPTPTARVVTSTKPTVAEAIAAVAPSPSPRQIQPTIAGANALKVEPIEAIQPEISPVPTSDLFIPVSERASILTLNERTCKWPIGDPSSDDFYFCGRQSDAGTPYCAHHRSIAYQPVSDRRNRRAS